MCLVLLSYFLVIPGDLGVDSETGGVRPESLRAADLWDAPHLPPHSARLLAVPDDWHPVHIREEGGRRGYCQ